MNLSLLAQDPFSLIMRFFLETSIYWAPLVCAYIIWILYLYYIRVKWLKNLNTVLLEVKIAKEISKSPHAMEVVLSGLHQTGEGSLIDKYIKGRLRSWFSLEIASFGGEIHFFIRTEFKFRHLVEAQIYSQYPEVEIYEVTDDYTNHVPYGLPGSDWELFGIKYGLTKEDAYPIKTYVDYGLDKDPKEEFKIDPMTSILEALASIGPGEQLWFQILVMASRERFPVAGEFFKKQDWTKQGQALIDKLMKRDEMKNTADFSVFTKTILAPSEQEVVKAVGRGLSKLGFDCGMRLLYLAKKEKYNGTRVMRMLTFLKAFSTQNLNGFKPAETTNFDYPWQDFMGIRLRRLKGNMFDSYRRRSYFWEPASETPFVLNTEELATIFHFPGKVAETPTLSRIGSKKGEPPSNLPV